MAMHQTPLHIPTPAPVLPMTLPGVRRGGSDAGARAGELRLIVKDELCQTLRDHGIHPDRFDHRTLRRRAAAIAELAQESPSRQTRSPVLVAWIAVINLVAVAAVAAFILGRWTS